MAMLAKNVSVQWSYTLLLEMFPVFAKGVSPKGSIYYLESIGFNIPLTCGGVQVSLET